MPWPTSSFSPFNAFSISMFGGKGAKGFEKAEGKFSSLADREPRFADK